MKEIDNVGLKLCEYQANLFEASLSILECSSIYFIKIFMNSILANRIDKPAFILESIDVDAALYELKQTNKLNRGKEKYPTYVMKWIGYMYRYFSYTYEFSSKRVYEIIKPKELYALYEAYHSLDPKEAISRIVDSKNVKSIDLIELAKKHYLF